MSHFMGVQGFIDLKSSIDLGTVNDPITMGSGYPGIYLGNDQFSRFYGG
jgi:hypothetical protein